MRDRIKTATITLEDDDSTTVMFTYADGKQTRSWTWDAFTSIPFLTNNAKDIHIVDDCLKAMQEEKSGRYLLAIGKAKSALRFAKTDPNISEYTRDEYNRIVSVLADLESELLMRQSAKPTPESLSSPERTSIEH